eukprot:1161803-Pelagomonas_calceolata.AAC.21
MHGGRLLRAGSIVLKAHQQGLLQAAASSLRRCKLADIVSGYVCAGHFIVSLLSSQGLFNATCPTSCTHDEKTFGLHRCLYLLGVVCMGLQTSSAKREWLHLPGT